MAPPSVQQAHDQATQDHRLWAESCLLNLLHCDDCTAFLPQKEEALPIPKGELLDSPIRMDSLYARPTHYIHHLAYNNSNGK